MRPRVTLKLATSLDSRIATRLGESKWITGPAAREEVHRMRAAHDAVLTGIGTVLADDPLLTARTDPPVARQPLRIVLDRQARLGWDSQLMRSLGQGGIVWCTAQSPMPPKDTWPKGLVHHLVPAAHYAGATAGVDLEAVLERLMSDHKVKSVMVEAGPGIATAFMRAGLVDEIAWFRAPILLGGDGRAVFDSLGVDALNQAHHFQLMDQQTFGPDLLETFCHLPNQKV